MLWFITSAKRQVASVVRSMSARQTKHYGPHGWGRLELADTTVDVCACDNMQVYIDVRTDGCWPLQTTPQQASLDIQRAQYAFQTGFSEVVPKESSLS